MKEAKVVDGHCSKCGARAIGGMLLCLCAGLSKPVAAAPVAYVTDKKLRERQEYYRYEGSPTRFKDAPVLNAELAAAMKAEHLYQNFRFVWGGVVIVRTDENSPTGDIVRGSKEACHVVNGMMMPKWPYIKEKQARSYYYESLGEKVYTLNRDLAPPDVIVSVDYRYVMLGQLFWYLEERFNADALIAGRVYSKTNPPPAEEWLCVMRLSSKTGLYYEPGMEMIDVLRQRVHENENADLKKLGRERLEAQHKREQELEELLELEDHKSFSELFDDVENFVKRNPKSVNKGASNAASR